MSRPLWQYTQTHTYTCPDRKWLIQQMERKSVFIVHKIQNEELQRTEKSVHSQPNFTFKLLKASVIIFTGWKPKIGKTKAIKIDFQFIFLLYVLSKLCICSPHEWSELGMHQIQFQSNPNPILKFDLTGFEWVGVGGYLEGGWVWVWVLVSVDRIIILPTLTLPHPQSAGKKQEVTIILRHILNRFGYRANIFSELFEFPGFFEFKFTFSLLV